MNQKIRNIKNFRIFNQLDKFLKIEEISENRIIHRDMDLSQIRYGSSHVTNLEI